MRNGNVSGWLPAPPPFRLTSSSTAELREGGGWITLLGAPFLIAGIFLARTIARVVPPEHEPSGGWWRLPLFALLSLVFLGAGGLLLFARRWLTLDVGSGSLVRSTGLLIPMWREHRSLIEFNAVVIAFEAGDSESPDHYPVRLRATAAKDFVVYSPTQFAKSRTLAEFVSRFLRLPLVDSTTDHEVVVQAENAGDTLQERLRSTDSRKEMVKPPPAMQCEVTQFAGGATIVIPRRKSVPALALAGLMSSVVMLLAAPSMWGFLSRPDTSVGSRFLFLGIMALLFGILPLGAIGHALGVFRSGTVVTATSAGIVIERQALWRKKTTAVSAAGIFDVDCSTMEGMLESGRNSVGYPRIGAVGGAKQGGYVALKTLMPSHGIVVKSRQGLVTFGEGLAAEELRYLRSVLTNALVG